MNNVLAFGIGYQELILILIVFLLLFGAKRLPELARGLGKSIREFKKATSEIEDNIREAMDEEEKKSAQVNNSEKSEPSAPAQKTEEK
ncbi:MAG: twin-arginine translocase TatA/TatE family subunit [Verrucomicrobia bacterium]|nr:MAG: twin-arginine translocase TatA/TatE family subunit [Verrucomicrobiota bacterium]